MGEGDAYVARLEEALRECVRLSGADLSDGFPTWPELPEFAVQEVKELRDCYEECPVPEDLEELRSMLDAIVDDPSEEEDWECVKGTNLDKYRRFRGDVDASTPSQ
jgi:hypothetical protein